jgi:hypothetical protein
MKPRITFGPGIPFGQQILYSIVWISFGNCYLQLRGTPQTIAGWMRTMRSSPHVVGRMQDARA